MTAPADDPLAPAETGHDGAAAVAGTAIGIRAFACNVSGVLNTVTATGLPVILTKHGRPVVAVVPVDFDESRWSDDPEDLLGLGLPIR
jgi:prevent-host-death family protein